MSVLRGSINFHLALTNLNYLCVKLFYIATHQVLCVSMKFEVRLWSLVLVN